jgi:hypothetical protein
MAVAGCGSLGFQLLWLRVLSGLQGDTDIVRLNQWAPAALRDLQAKLPKFGGHMVCHIG